MSKTNIKTKSKKQTLKEALAEALSEQRDLLREVFLEALEDFALIEAIQKGKKSARASRDEVLGLLRGRR